MKILKKNLKQELIENNNQLIEEQFNKWMNELLEIDDKDGLNNIIEKD